MKMKVNVTKNTTNLYRLIIKESFANKHHRKKTLTTIVSDWNFSANPFIKWKKKCTRTATYLLIISLIINYFSFLNYFDHLIRNFYSVFCIYWFYLLAHICYKWIQKIFLYYSSYISIYIYLDSSKCFFRT